MLPRLASGGLMPKPRKESAASMTTESATPRSQATTSGASAPAAACGAKMMRRWLAPSALRGLHEVHLAQRQELAADEAGRQSSSR